MPLPPLSAGVWLTLSCTQTHSHMQICTLFVHPALFLCRHFESYAHVVMWSRMHLVKIFLIGGAPGFSVCLYLCSPPSYKSGLQGCRGLRAAYLAPFLASFSLNESRMFFITQLFVCGQCLAFTQHTSFGFFM